VRSQIFQGGFDLASGPDQTAVIARHPDGRYSSVPLETLQALDAPGAGWFADWLERGGAA